MNVEPLSYSVKAVWVKGIVGWCIANSAGRFTWTQSEHFVVWYFEHGQDAVAFRLVYGL